jgi:hypothetical protein
MITEKQISEAKDFLKRRLAAELSMNEHLKEELTDAAKEIVRISLKYNIPPRNFRFSSNKELLEEVGAVIKKLRETVYIHTEFLSCYARKEDREEVIGYINAETHGKTLKERISIYCNRYKFEVESAIASGLLLGKSGKEIENSISSNLNAPYNNPSFKEAVRQGVSSESRIAAGGISYGVGVSNSAFNSLNKLTRNTIADAWMWWQFMSHKRDGAVGYYQYRGSSFPCGLCDSEVGYHPIGADYGLPHPYCKCFRVYVY